MVYNLQLLKAMLEVWSYVCHSLMTSSSLQVSAVDGCVDQATYSHVIRLWVKDVRERSNQQATTLEVSQLSDSEVRGHSFCIQVTTQVCDVGGR